MTEEIKTIRQKVEESKHKLHGADLRGADLDEANLDDAELKDANLNKASLRMASLKDANLSGANLMDAYMRGAKLMGANLRGANMIEANVRWTNFTDANLSEANLSGANLIEADLTEADLRRANLLEADLQEANLKEADLSEADLSEADLRKTKNLSCYQLKRAKIDNLCMKECPCGSDFPFTDCCAPIIRGTGLADTAEDLMRSRYSAFVFQDWAYLLNTVHPDERKNKTEQDIAAGSTGVKWKQLEIFNVRKGGAQDTEGEVSFAASYTEGDTEKCLRETSRFIRQDGRWYYSPKRSRIEEKESQPEPFKPFVRESPKIGRNDPCSCGSGKKFKKCCGK
jgi:SEC-C motif-containing protein